MFLSESIRDFPLKNVFEINLKWRKVTSVWDAMPFGTNAGLDVKKRLKDTALEFQACNCVNVWLIVAMVEDVLHLFLSLRKVAYSRLSHSIDYLLGGQPASLLLRGSCTYSKRACVNVCVRSRNVMLTTTD